MDDGAGYARSMQITTTAEYLKIPEVFMLRDISHFFGDKFRQPAISFTYPYATPRGPIGMFHPNETR